jgi:hypothetical protein
VKENRLGAGVRSTANLGSACLAILGPVWICGRRENRKVSPPQGFGVETGYARQTFGKLCESGRSRDIANATIWAFRP